MAYELWVDLTAEQVDRVKAHCRTLPFRSSKWQRALKQSMAELLFAGRIPHRIDDMLPRVMFVFPSKAAAQAWSLLRPR